MAQIDVSIVVLTHNRKNHLAELLTQLSRIEVQGLERIVVDNASVDGTKQFLEERFPGCICLRSEENLGACGRNLGMEAARGSIVITLDDDLLGLTAEAICYLQRLFSEKPTLGAVTFRVEEFETGRLTNWVHHRTPDDADKQFMTYEITEGAVAFRREALVAAGYYYPKYFLSHEGPDLAFRLMNAGYTVEYDGNVCVEHKHATESRASWRTYYFDTRNQFWLAARNMPFWYGLRFLGIGLTAMAVYSFRDGYFRYWAKAIWHGCRELPEVLRTRTVWTASTRATCCEIDKHRLPFWRMVRRRIFQPGNRRLSW